MNLKFQDYFIRSWRESDVYSLQKYANNRKIWLNLRDIFPHPYTLNDAKWWVKHASQEVPERLFAIATATETIGSIGIKLGEDIHRCSAELGYWLAEPFWGQGITTNAVKYFSKYVFDHFSIHRLHAKIFSNNQASIRVLEKADFKLEGVQKASAIKDGKIFDQHVYVKFKDGFY